MGRLTTLEYEQWKKANRKWADGVAAEATEAAMLAAFNDIQAMDRVEAATQPAEGLDVERLARALDNLQIDIRYVGPGHAPDPKPEDIAAEYVRLREGVQP